MWSGKKFFLKITRWPIVSGTFFSEFQDFGFFQILICVSLPCSTPFPSNTKRTTLPLPSFTWTGNHLGLGFEIIHFYLISVNYHEALINPEDEPARFEQWRSVLSIRERTWFSFCSKSFNNFRVEGGVGKVLLSFFPFKKQLLNTVKYQRKHEISLLIILYADVLFFFIRKTCCPRNHCKNHPPGASTLQSGSS